MSPFGIDFLWSTGILLQLPLGASDQWKLSQKLVVSMVMKQLQCDAPRLDIGSDVLDLPPTNSHDQDDCYFSRESLFKKLFATGILGGGG